MHGIEGIELITLADLFLVEARVIPLKIGGAKVGGARVVVMFSRRLLLRSSDATTRAKLEMVLLLLLLRVTSYKDISEK